MLQDIARTYSADREAGRDVLLMQKLVPIMARVSGAMDDLEIDRLTILGNHSAANGTASLAGTLVGVSEQIKAATGLDVPAMLGGRGATGAATP